MSALAHPLLKIYDHFLGTIVPWWDTVLMFGAFLIIIIGKITPDYVPGKEKDLLSCHNASSDLTELKYLTQCVYQLSWIERNFGFLSTIVAFTFGLIVVIWRLHPEARAAMSGWIFILDEIQNFQDSEIYEYNRRMSVPRRKRKVPKGKFVTIAKMKEIIDSRYDTFYLGIMTSYCAKYLSTCSCLIFLIRSWYSIRYSSVCVLVHFISTPYQCMKEEQVFKCILKPYCNYCTTLWLFTVILIISAVVMLKAHSLLGDKRFGTTEYMKEMLLKQKSIPKCVESKIDNVARS